MSDPKKSIHTVSDPIPHAPVAQETRDLGSDPSRQATPLQTHDLRFLSAQQAPDELGRLGGYRIMRVIGEGGMGIVLEAEDVRLNRRIAIKVMKPEVASGVEHRQRFLREAQAAAAIEHDYIVPILQVGEDNSVLFIAMPYLKGEPLNERMKRGRLGLRDILLIGRQTAEGLNVAHEQGLIHRDVEPANIWLEEVRGAPGSCRVRILDFGLARFAGEEGRITELGAVMGTPAYMSPEQANGSPVDHLADLFSLGAVLYELATGRLPFRGQSNLQFFASLANDTPPVPATLNPEMPPALSRLIVQLLEKDPAKRLSSAHEVASMIKNLQTDSELLALAKLQPGAIAEWAESVGSGSRETVLPAKTPPPVSPPNDQVPQSHARPLASRWPRRLRVPGIVGILALGIVLCVNLLGDSPKTFEEQVAGPAFTEADCRAIEEKLSAHRDELGKILIEGTQEYYSKFKAVEALRVNLAASDPRVLDVAVACKWTSVRGRDYTTEYTFKINRAGLGKLEAKGQEIAARHLSRTTENLRRFYRALRP